MAETRTRLADLPTDVQELLKGMTPGEFDLLGCEARGQAHHDRLDALPADAEGAAKGARAALKREAHIMRDEPLGDFLAFWTVLRMALVAGASDPLGEVECDALHRVAEIADELLSHHHAAVEEAGNRLRAYTHPLPPFGGHK